MFTAEFNMCEGGPEANYCVVPKGGPIRTLESICSKLLADSRQILDAPDLAHQAEFEVMVPVIVTNAKLFTCNFVPQQEHLKDGCLDVSEGNFRETQFVRFRKSLVSYRSRTLTAEALPIREWKEDRERTVFVVQAQHLTFFLSGFRAFSFAGETEYPPDYMSNE